MAIHRADVSLPARALGLAVCQLDVGRRALVVPSQSDRPRLVACALLVSVQSLKRKRRVRHNSPLALQVLIHFTSRVSGQMLVKRGVPPPYGIFCTMHLIVTD